MTTINDSGDLVWRIYRVAGNFRYCIAAFFTRNDAEFFYKEQIEFLHLEDKYLLELYHEDQVH